MSTDRMGPLPKRPPALHHPVVVDHASAGSAAADFQLRIEAQELRLNTEIRPGRSTHSPHEIHRHVVEDPGRRN